jgi:hypothetical protein
MKSAARHNTQAESDTPVKPKRSNEAITARSITAEQIILVDAKGNRRVSLHATKDRAVFEMFNGAGQSLLNITVVDNGETSINIFSRVEPFEALPDETSLVKRLELGHVPMSKRDARQFKFHYRWPNMRMFDGLGNERAILGVYPSHNGRLSLDGEKGRISLEADQGLLMFGGGEDGQSFFAASNHDQAQFNRFYPVSKQPSEVKTKGGK